MLYLFKKIKEEVKNGSKKESSSKKEEEIRS